MKDLKRTVLIFATLTVLLANLPSAHANDIWDDSGNLNDKTNAKVMRHMAQQRALEASMSKEELEAMQQNNGGCGSVDIGNIKGGQSGDIETVVIIKGDVINTNNKCN